MATGFKMDTRLTRLTISGIIEFRLAIPVPRRKGPNPMPDADDPISLFLTHQDIRVILDDLKAAERRQQHKDAVITFIDDIDVVRERHLFSEHRLRLIETLDKLLWPGPKLPSGGIQEAF
jgi:hypothetical protein